MSNYEINPDWNDALKLCLELADLSNEDKFRHIISLNVSESIKSKAIKIINRANEKNTLLDGEASSFFLGEIEKNQDLVGLKINNYQLIKLIAKGGMSSIYEAIVITSEIQKTVAVKILSPHVYSEKSLELFKREQLILSELDHPNIVSFHHSGQGADGMHYLVMEYIKNSQNIQEYCHQKNLSVRAIVKLVKEIADICMYAHKNLIIHRDIKAENILVDKNRRVKLIDFGIGQFTSENNQNVTKVFTIETASPEQILGKRVTIQTDVFSLGALLLQLLIKRNAQPNINIAQYDPLVVQTHYRGLLYESDLDSDLQNIINQAMHIDTEKRYQNMNQLFSDLDNWLNKRPVMATKDSFNYRLIKFVTRNKGTTLLTAFILILIITSSILIYRTDLNRKSELEKKNQSLEIIRSVFQHANPLTQSLDESTINKGFNVIKLDKNTLLNADPELEFLIYSEIAELYKSNNHHLEAIENMEIAITKLSGIKDKDDQLFIDSEAQLINILSSGGKYDESKKKAHKLIARLDKDEPQHISALTIANLSIAQSHYILNNVNEAAHYLSVCLDLVYNRNDILIDEILKADVLNLKALIHKHHEEYEESEKAYLEVVRLLRSNKNGIKDLSTNLTNLGVLMMDQDKNDEAEKYFIESKKVIALYDENHTQIAVNNIQYSDLLRSQGRYLEAKNLLLESLPILKSANDKRQLIWLYTGLTNFALHENNINDALNFFEQGFELSYFIYGLDHPHTLKLINKLLSTALIQSNSIDVAQIIRLLDDQLTTRSKNSIEYEDYEILRSIYKKETVKNDFELSVLTELLFDKEYHNPDNKLIWLESKKNETNVDQTVLNFINVWLQEFKPNEIEFDKYCARHSDWNFTYIYPFKLNFLHMCKSIGVKNNFTKTNKINDLIQSIDDQVKINKQRIERIIDSIK